MKLRNLSYSILDTKYATSSCGTWVKGVIPSLCVYHISIFSVVMLVIVIFLPC